MYSTDHATKYTELYNLDDEGALTEPLTERPS